MLSMVAGLARIQSAPWLSHFALAGRAKGMMAERLAVSEAKLMKMHQDEASAEELKHLVAIKLELAQSRFEALELQVRSLFCPKGTL